MVDEIVRKVEFDNGRIVTFKTDAIRPFWRIHFENGPLPDKLSGMYQHFEDAKYAVELYMSQLRSDRRAAPKRKS